MNRKIYSLITIASVTGTTLFGCSSTQTSIAPAQADQRSQTTQASPGQLREPDVIYVPTPPEVVNRMLEIAKVNRNDVLYDLGSGDGRIPITAAQRFGIRATGIDINPQRIQEANANAQQAGVTNRVRFLNQDLFTSNFSDATVVTLYLLPELNIKLRPQLFQQLKPGTRVVSHAFDMGGWKPDRSEQVEVNGNTYTIYLWTVPQQVPANLRANTSN